MLDYLIIEAWERNEDTNIACADHPDLLGRERERATGATMAVADSRHALCGRATAASGLRSARSLSPRTGSRSRADHLQHAARLARAGDSLPARDAQGQDTGPDCCQWTR